VIRCPESWARFAPRLELVAIVDELGDDEVRVLARIAGRLLRGMEIYGALGLPQDLRDFDTEAREEVEDCLVYLACRWLRDRA
jgi:hypothetical protein